MFSKIGLTTKKENFNQIHLVEEDVLKRLLALCFQFQNLSPCSRMGRLVQQDRLQNPQFHGGNFMRLLSRYNS